ncbi:hypothetical protein LXL04_019870 [Taraxacum kok-saghyz]
MGNIRPKDATTQETILTSTMEEVVLQGYYAPPSLYLAAKCWILLGCTLLHLSKLPPPSGGSWPPLPPPPGMISTYIGGKLLQIYIFGVSSSPHAQDFLLAIPIDGLGQHMSPVEYRTIIKYRLLIPLFPVDELCPICRKACLNYFGEHAVDCKDLPGFKRAGISTKKEAPVNFLTDPLEGRSTLRPADILVFGWIGGKHACVDLTGVSPLVGLRNEAALKAVSCKVMKHEKACIENQHVFILFAFDTFAFLAPEAVDLLNRVQRVMHSNVMTPKSMDVVFKRGCSKPDIRKFGYPNFGYPEISDSGYWYPNPYPKFWISGIRISEFSDTDSDIYSDIRKFEIEDWVRNHTASMIREGNAICKAANGISFNNDLPIYHRNKCCPPQLVHVSNVIN